MTTDSKTVQGDWAEQIARAAMGRHAVDVVALDEVASQLRAAEHRGYTMGHKAGDDFRSAALASTAGAGAWRPMNTAPSDTPIVARHKPNSRTPHGWVATISRAPEDPDERVGGLDTILHYNGNALMCGFHGVWVGWMYPEEFAALALSAGTLSVGWDGARDAFARIVEDRAWTAEHGEPRAACLRAASDIRQAKAPAVPASPRSGAGEGEELERLRSALEFIAEAHDAGRHDGVPEPCPAHDADTMWGVAVAALSQGGGAGRSERAVEIRELSEKATQGIWTALPYEDGDDGAYLLIDGKMQFAAGMSTDEANLAVAVVNAYRSGELVHRSEPAGRSEKGEGKLPGDLVARITIDVRSDENTGTRLQFAAPRNWTVCEDAVARALAALKAEWERRYHCPAAAAAGDAEADQLKLRLTRSQSQLDIAQDALVAINRGRRPAKDAAAQALLDVSMVPAPWSQGSVPQPVAAPAQSPSTSDREG